MATEQLINGKRPALSLLQILGWADAHRLRTGKWPQQRSGEIIDATGETWAAVDLALTRGLRDLPGGLSLAKALAKHRRAGNRANLRRLTTAQILKCAEAHRRRGGALPTKRSGSVADAPGETWGGINSALRAGYRGLTGGSSLAMLLVEHLGACNATNRPRLAVRKILCWADLYYVRHRRWPSQHSGSIPGTAGETWRRINGDLRHGRRGLRGRSSLGRLLAKRRGKRYQPALPSLSVEQILTWADAYFKRHGKWPGMKSGPISQAPGETWRAADHALRNGYRGQAGGSSLEQLLSEHRGAHDARGRPLLSIERILEWADAHFQRFGRWPAQLSGAVINAPDETWRDIDSSLRKGCRGLPGGASLPALLGEHRGARNRTRPPPLTVAQILAWADAYYARHGRWPSQQSGSVDAVSGENWGAIDWALSKGGRGVPGRTTLAELLNQQRGARNRANPPRLTIEQILAWADAFHARHGRWPSARAGPIDGADGETWRGVQQALYVGRRGLAGGSSLPKLLDKHLRGTAGNRGRRKAMRRRRPKRDAKDLS